MEEVAGCVSHAGDNASPGRSSQRGRGRGRGRGRNRPRGGRDSGRGRGRLSRSRRPPNFDSSDENAHVQKEDGDAGSGRGGGGGGRKPGGRADGRGGRGRVGNHRRGRVGRSAETESPPFADSAGPRCDADADPPNHSDVSEGARSGGRGDDRVDEVLTSTAAEGGRGGVDEGKRLEEDAVREDAVLSAHEPDGADDNDDDGEADDDESLLRAIADLELLRAAYPDEIDVGTTDGSAGWDGRGRPHRPRGRDESSSSNSVAFVLRLPPAEGGAYVEMEFPGGYPVDTGVRVKSYRGGSGSGKSRIEAVAAAVRAAASECLECGEEGGLACCAAALEAWKEHAENGHVVLVVEEETVPITGSLEAKAVGEGVPWITGEALVDRKSVFQAHVCPVHSEKEVRRALDVLISGSTKIQRATHNMYAYRFTESLPDGRTILKHDNYDDGEDGAGSRMARLLQMMDENGVLVVVSRWYGGIHLGPKRFAHINNVARELLVRCREDGSIN